MFKGSRVNSFFPDNFINYITILCQIPLGMPPPTMGPNIDKHISTIYIMVFLLPCVAGFMPAKFLSICK